MLLYVKPLQCCSAVTLSLFIGVLWLCCGSMVDVVFFKRFFFFVTLPAIAAMAPERRGDISRCAIRALISGTVACFMTACIAGNPQNSVRYKYCHHHALSSVVTSWLYVFVCLPRYVVYPRAAV